MSGLDDFADLAVHTVSWEPRTAIDAYNKPTFGASKDFKSRVDFKRRNFTNAQGQVIQIRGTVTIFGDNPPDIAVVDRITLPDGSTPPILDAAVVDDLDGTPHHTEVMFG